ncbi:DNA polymerase [Pseudomonas phage Lana]|uniref:DNA polymerase n=1 Tax=Pseudomonas phage Lana TaxID=2530172 RepID=A0A481W7Z0_9CAUD|nr:DNA polymerase [Pseudomonas phage Lana]QBJ04532.1 DNA polymerase I [Pseudomonas phage Lana]
MTNPLQIIDFRACIKHAYYGVSDKTLHCTKLDRRFADWQAGAADFLTRYIRPILEKGGSPREMLVAHDAGKAYRLGIYPAYKGQAAKEDKNKSPIEIAQYKELSVWARKFFAALGATQMFVENVEADDLIGWICNTVPGPKDVSTVDADLLVLVNQDTIVTLKNVAHHAGLNGEDGVYPEGMELAGLPYRLTSFAKSIMGDTSDNYPGVKGMGPAKILKLLEAYGADGLDELAEIVAKGNTDLLDETIAESGDKILIKLRENFGDWRMGWKLANLKPELCWKPRLKKLTKPKIHKRVPDPTALYNCLKEIGCEDMWEAEYSHLMPVPMIVDSTNWDKLKEQIFEEIKAGDKTAFDYESSDKNPIRDFRIASTSGSNFVDMLSQELAGASFQFGRHLENVIYIPVDHRDSNNVNKDVILEILEFAGKYTRRIAHNALFEGVVTQTNLGVWLKEIEDTRIMQRFYDENMEAGLKALSLNYLGYEQTSFQDTLAAGNGGEGVSMMCELTADEVFTYGTDDSLVTGHLHDLLELLLKLDGQWDFYRRWAVRPTEVLQRSYVAGVDMNWACQKRIHAQDLKTIEEGMLELRAILEKNVTGNITPGCKSLIDAEKDYIFRGAKKKAEGNVDVANSKVAEWRKKLEAACQYTPFREESVMPDFAFTANQLAPALLNLDLPPLEKLTQKAITEWYYEVGVAGFEDEWKVTDDQRELIKAIATAVAAGCLKMGDLRRAADESESAEDTCTHKLFVAEKAFDELGALVQKLAKVEPRIVTFGDPLNVGSPVQMQQLLYCKIGIPVKLRGKNIGKGRLAVGIQEAGPSTDEQAILTALANDVLQECWQRDALVILRRVKSANTRCSLYHDKYPMWRHRDGKVHPSITDAGTDTTRPTGSAPNILQVAKRGEGKVMRSIYIPPTPDHVCVAIDFNGQEIRLMANLANDPVMMSVYDPANEKDLHSMTGSGIAKMTYEDFIEAKDDENHKLNKITVAIRGKAKTVNFGMAYGAGAGTLSRNLIVPVEEAKKLLDGTFDLYTRIRPWQAETAQFMTQNGFTLTAFGTKRHATPDLFSNDSGRVARQHRQGTNATIQGSAAQMLRIVLTRIAESGIMDRLRMVFFAPIYDEVVSWVHKDDVYDYCQEVGRYMEESTPPGHKVRQVPEFSIGCDWGKVHELGRNISQENVAAFVDRALTEGINIWEKDLLEPFDPIRKPTYVELDEDEEVVSDNIAD